MRFVTYQTTTSLEPRLGWITDEFVWDVQLTAAEQGFYLPPSLLKLLEMEQAGMEAAHKVYRGIHEQRKAGHGVAASQAVLLPPLPMPRSYRDFYAFEQHVKTARLKRGKEMIPEWYEIPVFYFSNHQSITGPDAEIRKPVRTEKLDFELEVACVIGRKGINIAAAEADFYIAGFTILNDWSARDLQQQEMKVGLGPAKGKDFATSIGPWLVTPDELHDRKTAKSYDLEMIARINEREVSRGNLKDLYWSFGEMIQRASEDTMLYPGDLIGSGTVGTGCILELGTDKVPWLQPGDRVELVVERLGSLRNTIC